MDQRLCEGGSGFMPGRGHDPLRADGRGEGGHPGSLPACGQRPPDAERQNLVEAGAALMVADATLGGGPEPTVRELIGDPERLKRMGERAAALAQPGPRRRSWISATRWWEMNKEFGMKTGTGPLRGHRRHRDERHRRSSAEPGVPGDRIGPGRVGHHAPAAGWGRKSSSDTGRRMSGRRRGGHLFGGSTDNVEVRRPRNG